MEVRVEADQIHFPFELDVRAALADVNASARHTIRNELSASAVVAERRQLRRTVARADRLLLFVAWLVYSLHFVDDDPRGEVASRLRAEGQKELLAFKRTLRHREDLVFRVLPAMLGEAVARVLGAAFPMSAPIFSHRWRELVLEHVYTFIYGIEPSASKPFEMCSRRPT